MDKIREFLADEHIGNTPDLPSAEFTREYLAVDILPSYAGMGGGGNGDGDPQTGLVSRQLVEQELRAKVSDLLLIEARGESMTPDFIHGDQILIDRRDCNPVQPGSFALWDGDGYVIKLVERVPHKPGWYRIFSANDRYSAYEVDAEQIKIMGRPVWFARRL
jgi:phage repressor protein C with HTH and peptisase S24 domain